jgi:hypothetical protein
MKLKKVIIETELGHRTLLMKPISSNSLSLTISMCESFCPYFGICRSLPDPRDLEDENSNFLNCCIDCIPTDPEPGEDGLNYYYVPAENSIEQALGKEFPSIVAALSKGNPIFHLNDIIDNVCNGWCDKYKADHSGCNPSNPMCLFRKLVKTIPTVVPKTRSSKTKKK